MVFIRNSSHAHDDRGAKRPNGESRFKRVVEGDLIIVESELFATLPCRPHVLGELYEYLDDLGCLDRPVLVLPQCLLQHLRERARLDDVALAARLDLALQQLLQQLHGKIPLGHAADLSEKLVRQNRDIRFLQTGGGEDVDNLVGDHRLRDDLPNGVVQILISFAFASETLGEHGTHRLEETHIVSNAQ